MGTSAYNVGVIEFYIFVHTTAWVFICVHILLNLLGIFLRLPDVLINHFISMIYCIVAAFSFLICSSIVLGKWLGYWKTDAGGSLGLIATVIFIVESLYHFMKWKNGISRKPEPKKKDTSDQGESLNEQGSGY